MRHHILVVDDEGAIRTLIRKYAEFSGYDVSEAANGAEAVEKCQKNRYDLIIMDIMMPVLDGISAAQRIKESSDVPILILSAKGEEDDRIGGFRAGADDYVVKPFSVKELMLRADAIIKRTAGSRKADGNFTYEGLTVDENARRVTVDGKEASLSPREYDLLFFMIRNRGIALSRNTLIENVWGFDFNGDERTLDTHIKLLRKSLGNYSSLIVTLRGTGYRFNG